MPLDGGGSIIRDLGNDGYHGTFSGSTTWGTSRFGTCLDFPGTTSFANVGDQGGLSFGNGTTDSPMTISAWIYRRNASTITPVTKYGGGVQEYRFVVEGANITMNAYDESASAFIGRRTSTVTVADNTWNHIAGTYDASAGNAGFAIYFNGVRSDTTNVSSGTYTAMENTTQAVEIGRIYGTAYADGLIDMITIHNRVLSESEILMSVYDPFLPFRWAAMQRSVYYSMPSSQAPGGSIASSYYRRLI